MSHILGAESEGLWISKGGFRDTRIPSVGGIFRNIVAAIFRDLSRYSPIFSDIPEQLQAVDLAVHASAARPRREARPFYRLIERDMPLRAAFWPEVREFISHKGCQ